RRKLLSPRRSKEVTGSSEFSWDKDDYTEFYLTLDRDALARCNISVGELYSALAPAFGRDLQCGLAPNSSERILLSSSQSNTYDVWSLMNIPFTSGKKTFRLSQFATVDQLNAPRAVAKENQQYVLCIQYEYIGSYTQGHKILDEDIKEFRKTLPMGYSINEGNRSYRWSDASANNYWLLLLVAAIIFWITAILFNSLRWPLIIIITIPISFIGLFLGFYWTKMNFDQGGFAAFVLLCGITVNAAIYLISEYHRSRNYLRAFNAKIIPILLTVVSTILGFIPFMVGPDSPEAFWFPLALGTISGLLTSLLALILILPLLLPRVSGPAKGCR
ncbi:MAG: efflux RND transporter permease subunit, partial [Muribaculaceae bacterium]|nr:efflux RND transporter permease subunit [Muribaculaceae bacterium]